MTVITPERLKTTQGIVTKLVEQGQQLYTDIAETAKDRVRLSEEVDHRDGVIERLTVEVQDLRARVRTFEDQNNKLIDDATQLESMLADLTARLDAIGMAARLDLELPTKRADGSDPAGAAGVIALQRLARSNNHGGPTS